MKLSLSLTLVLFYFFIAHAQKPPMKWGKVPEEDLKMTTYEKDTAANAVVLCNYANLDFNFATGDIQMRFEHHKRIKILKRSGFDQGDINIPFYKGEKVQKLRAQVILPNGKKYDVDKKNIFKEKVSDHWNRYKISFPNLEEGAIIEYKYQLLSEFILELKEWYFQEDIPVRWSEYRLEIPKWYDYVMLRQGPNLDISEQTSEFSNIRIPSSDSYGYTSQSSNVETEIRFYRMVKKDLPALKEENYITTMDDYLMRIRFQLNSINYTEVSRKPILSNWPDVAKKLMAGDYFGKQLHNKRKIKSLIQAVDPLLKNIPNPDAKALAIYHYLAGTMTWDESYSYGLREDINTCFEQKKASSGELNLMLIALFNHYGIEASPVLLSTRTHGKMIDLYPILDQFNHTIAAAKINGKYQLFDVGSPFRPAGLLRMNSCNSQAWLVDPVSPQWITIIPPKNSSVKLVSMQLSEDGKLVGDVTSKVNGYEAASTRASIAKNGYNTYYENDFKEKFPDILIDSIAIEAEQNIYKDLEVKVSCHLPDQAQVVGDFIYMNPILLPVFEENPFKIEERTYPVDIPYPIKDRFVLLLTIPEGYAVEELPENLNLALPNKGGRFYFSVNPLGQKVQISYNFQLDQLQFQPEEYKGLKRFFDMMLEKLDEQIVLKKI